MKKIILVVIILQFVICNLKLHSQPGSLDLTFGIGGKVTTDIGSVNDGGKSVTIQPDGKIVVAGWSDNGSNWDFALARYNSNGSLDNAFDGDGKLTTDFGYEDLGWSVAIQPDGKIVVAGETHNGSDYDFAIIRYTNEGSLDSTFDGDGKLTTDFTGSEKGYSVALQNDGKIVVVGGSYSDLDLAIVRYNSDGTPDTTFGTSGKQTTDFGNTFERGNSIALQNDGKIVVAGESYFSFAIVRYNSDGTLDSTFGTNGMQTTAMGEGYGRSIALQSDGKIIVAGFSGMFGAYHCTIVRYNSDGILDSTFGTAGIKHTYFGNFCTSDGESVVLQSDGKIVVAGSSSCDNGFNYDFALFRYNTDGTLDTTFGTDGLQITDFGGINDFGASVSLQSDGKIVVAGQSHNGSNYDFAIVRYNGGNCSPVIFSQSPAICNGQSITVGSNTYTTSGTYIDTLVGAAASGCDSIVTTNLTVNPNDSITIDTTINNGDSIQVGSSIYKATGIYIDTLLAFNGCDSVVTTNLTVLTGIEKVGSGSKQCEETEIFPNPFSQNAVVRIPDDCEFANGKVELRVYNLLGQEVHRVIIRNSDSFIISRSNLVAGIYFYKVSNSQKEIIGSGKVVIE